MSWAMFGFSIARVGTCVLRIAWTYRLQNTSLAIASSVFLNVGVLVAYVVVLVLATRLLRATHPRLGWNPTVHNTATALYIGLLISILLTIAFSLTNLYTLDSELKLVALWIQRASLLYMLLFNLVSTSILLISAISPQAPDAENFGSGTLKSKLVIAGIANFFCLFIVGFRCGVSWSAERPASNPAWYDSKAAFYVIELGFEIMVIYLLIFVRFDRRFWVPNGSKGPGDYSTVHETVGEKDVCDIESA